MFRTIFLHIAMRTFVLAIGMTFAFVLTLCMLTFMFSFSVALTFVLTFGALTFVLAFCVTLAFMLAFSMLALVFAGSLALAFVLAFGALTFVLAFCVALAFMLAFSMLALVFASSLALAFVLTFGALTLVLSIAMTAGTTVLAACWQFLTCSGIGLHSISIITHLADFLAQLVRVGLLGIIIDRDFSCVGIIRVIFHTFEERNVVFETVNAFLTFQGSIGLDGNTLHLCVCTQGYYGHQGHQDKFFHFYCFINY